MAHPENLLSGAVHSNSERVQLAVRSDGKVTHLSIARGTSVRDALDTTELRVRAACGGTGSCGACVVRLIQGDVNPHTLAEYQKLTAEERTQGARLACQLRLKSDTEILLDHPARPSLWRSIPAEDLAPSPGKLPTLTQHIYGVAVDLGTTHIRVALWDRKRGKRIAARRGPNPQVAFGADVLNRLDAALASVERSAELAKLARTAIVQAVRDILARDVGEVAPMLAEIGQVSVVGNTAMLALLTEQGAADLIDPETWLHAVNIQPCDAAAWNAQWYMPNAAISVLPPVAGFVGSDLIANLIATNLTSGPVGSLLLDVGTNTEIALWDGHTLHVTSVPGGPAFEGGGIRFGMPAEPGAICSIRPLAGSDGFSCDTIGDSEARGFCGSGLADAISVLLAAGILKPSGRFAVAPGEEGYRFIPGNPRSALHGVDVDAFQRAKAATSAAMTQLLRQAGMGWHDLQRLCVCGAFGHTLNIAHAQAVGLLPQIDPSRVELYADATLAGCERALLSEGGDALFNVMSDKVQAINLSQAKGYDDCYIDHLRLRPVPAVV
ncbi:MAG: ASKHA domain-containing protein [Pseudomonadota bacterium]